MKRRLKCLISITAFLLVSSGCTSRTALSEVPAQSENQPAGQNNPSDQMEAGDTPGISDEQNGDVQIALVIDTSSALDGGFNQATLEGVQTYADAAGVSYSCCNAESDTPEAYENAITDAIQKHASLVICAGSHFEQTVGSLQNDYPDVFFLLLDGVPRDSSGDITAIAPNVHCITYREEEAGYLAGYMAVLDGYRKLGFIGGEQLPSVERYGYGYLQGIDDAAALLESSGDVHVDYWYADTFSPGRQIEEAARGWYQAGTEVIFACGGPLYQSVLASAESCGGMLIGVDVDQSGISEHFLTSATKGINSSVIVTLDEFFANGRKWPDKLSGSMISYGAKEKCISLPIIDNAWRFRTASINDYLQILAKLKAGDIQISDDADMQPETTVSVMYHNQ